MLDGAHASLADASAFAAFLKPLRKIKWVVYAKEPFFAGPEPVLRYLARYTHRVAISNSRLVAASADSVAFRWKDYRADAADRWQTMTLHPHEFIRRFLMHVLLKGFHRIRHYGLFANGSKLFFTPRYLAVSGISCIRPCAPTRETALGL